MMQTKKTTPQTWRSRVFMAATYIMMLAILGRLFYWQIIKGPELLLAAENQYTSFRRYLPSRGKILTSDGYSLVENQTVYRLFAEPHVLTRTPKEIAEVVTPILLEEKLAEAQAQTASSRDQTATDSGNLDELTQTLSSDIQKDLEEKLASDRKWVSLDSKIFEQTKEKIEELEIYGLGFDPYEIRKYPEASMAAHITGFVGKNEAGEDLGYFGVEGALNKELSGITVSQKTLTDAHGLPLLIADNANQTTAIPGRDVTLTIRRDIQFLIEKELEEGVRKYGAKGGEIVVLQPKTGKILGLAAWPKYDPARFYEYEPELYKNPSLANVYEPGSTFKTLTVSAGIDSGSILPNTPCPYCQGPRVIDKYTIKTWNDVYNPDISMTEALSKSDNIAMIFIAETLGSDVFSSYVRAFGIGEALEIDLQEDTTTPFPEKWGPVELATTSFGQGIVTNSLQLTRAVGAIANQGKLLRLQIVDSVFDPATNKSIDVPAEVTREVISAESAQTVTKMMVEAADAGEAQWTRSRTHTIAGKTGTSQVAEQGEYAEDKTIASFIGFAPAENPEFVMLVKLQEPSSSPWAAETAAPLWYKVADRLFLLLNIPPDKTDSGL